MAAMPSSKRLVRSILVALAVAVLLGSGIGFVAAGPGEDRHAFVMEAPHLGDEARYASSDLGEKTYADGHSEPVESSSNVSVAWGTRDPMLLPDGHWTNLVTLTE